MTMPFLVPLDFNSILSSDPRHLLSDFYVDYAFYQAGITPSDGLEGTFFDLDWRESVVGIICVDGTLVRQDHESGSWGVELRGRIYARDHVPARFISCFIGAGTFMSGWAPARSVEEAAHRPLEWDGELSGLSCFVLPEGTPVPAFAGIVGLSIEELPSLFPPVQAAAPAPLASESIVVRGGRNAMVDLRVGPRTDSAAGSE